MPSIYHGESLRSLVERDSTDDGWAGAGGARWAFFAIFIVLILIIVMGTLKVNKRRTQHGVQPIYGTRWMTPPSYLQSQNQYNQLSGRDPEMPSSYVPAYSATANEYDMGYYDRNGEFHPNPNAKSSGPLSNSSPQYPEQAHHRQSGTSDGSPINPTVPNNNNNNNTLDTHLEANEEDGDLFRPPHGPPPQRSQATQAMQTTTEVSSSMPGAFENHSTPPPKADDIAEGSSTGLESLPPFSEVSDPKTLNSGKF